MGLDQYAHLRGKDINFEKVYNSDDYDPKEDGFVWRKHARLQTFMNQQWQKQNEREAEKRNKPPTDPMDLSCLGMNAGDEVYITEDVLKELKEAYTVIKFLKSKINEVNLLNAKLLFSNKLFRNYSLNESQKMKVIENFDRAGNLREVKLIYSTLAEGFSLNKTKRQIKESYASKPAGKSTAPRKQVLSEGNDLAARWKKLANL